MEINFGKKGNLIVATGYSSIYIAYILINNIIINTSITMARKKTKRITGRPQEIALGYLEKMTIRDLKRGCIVRGCPFEEIVSQGVPFLEGWFVKNFLEDIDSTLLDEYDNWVEMVLRKRGLGDEYFHPMLRLGYIAEKDEEGNTKKAKRVKGIKKAKKAKKERTDDGIFKGTKKALTFQLQKEGKTKEETIELVRGNFEDVKEKSIGIWYNKARKLHGEA